ncbi:VOC family protein [Brevibacillus sp. SYSU BS000544]|uniref:VOC family protein n=1 Tax=Brevibacillus sp. SYSU BS000544 TaxID=3416443 RepID=UPI003CE57DCC
MSFDFLGIDHIQLAAPKGSEDQARAFFHGVLGWPEIPKPSELLKNGGVWFLCGSHHVHIGVEDNFLPAKKAHPAFEVKNLDGLREHLNQQGITYLDDERLEGATRFYLDDPFGNRMEFLEWLDR